MCGRYQLEDGREIRPTDSAPMLSKQGSSLSEENAKWGIMLQSEHHPFLNINARCESLFEKKSFAQMLLNGRAILPAKEFYEWDARKNRFTFRSLHGTTLYMAGLFRPEADGDKHFTIITTAANASMQPVHDRMPLLLEYDELERWLFEDDAVADILSQTPQELGRHAEYEQMRLF